MCGARTHFLTKFNEPHLNNSFCFYYHIMSSVLTKTGVIILLCTKIHKKLSSLLSFGLNCNNVSFLPQILLNWAQFNFECVASNYCLSILLNTVIIDHLWNKCNSKIKALTKSVLFFIFSFSFIYRRFNWVKIQIWNPLGVLWIKAGQLLSTQKKDGYETTWKSVVTFFIFWLILTLWEVNIHRVKIELS